MNHRPAFFLNKTEDEQKKTLYFGPTDFTIVHCFAADKFDDVVTIRDDKAVPFYEDLSDKGR